MSDGRFVPEKRNEGKPGASAASGGTRAVPQRPARRRNGFSIARVPAVAGAEFAHHRPRPDPGPPAGERRGFRLTVEETEIRQAGSAVAAGALEGEGVGVAPLPADAREQRIAAGQLVIHAQVGAVAIAFLREDLPIRAVAAGGQVRLVREWIEELEDATGRGVDALGWDAVARELPHR